MKTLKVQLEYKCYPVWIYDEDGNVEDTALPAELANDRALDERFKSLQDRFDATYVDTATDFYSKGFESSEGEAVFKSDLRSAVAELAKKCPEGYVLKKTSELI